MEDVICIPYSLLRMLFLKFIFNKVFLRLYKTYRKHVVKLFSVIFIIFRVNRYWGFNLGDLFSSRPMCIASVHKTFQNEISTKAGISLLA